MWYLISIKMIEWCISWREPTDVKMEEIVFK